jgi:hypothetical protein
MAKLKKPRKQKNKRNDYYIYMNYNKTIVDK